MGVFKDLTRFRKTYSYYRTVPIVMATSGDITAVYAGTSLTGGGTNGDVTLNLDSTISVDAIIERTAASGVTIDSVLLKDGKIETTEIKNPSGPLDILNFDDDITITGDEYLILASNNQSVAARGPVPTGVDFRTDEIAEDTLDAGVTIEGVLIKDGLLGSGGRDPDAIPVFIKALGDAAFPLTGDAIGTSESGFTSEFGFTNSQLRIPASSLKKGDVVSIYFAIGCSFFGGGGTTFTIKTRLTDTTGPIIFETGTMNWTALTGQNLVQLDLVITATPTAATPVFIGGTCFPGSTSGNGSTTITTLTNIDLTSEIIVVPTFKFETGTPNSGDVIVRSGLFAHIKKSGI